MLASELAVLVGGELCGSDREFSGVAPLQTAGAEDLAFTEGPVGEAGVLLGKVPVEGRTVVVSDDPRLAMIRYLESQAPPREVGVDAGASVHPSARLGPDVRIHPGVVVMEGCLVGGRSELFPGVVLYPRTVIGQDCRVHAGCVLGADGFGYHRTADAIEKMPQVGWVVLGDRVELGANCTIDRGTLGPTSLGDDTKIDDQVHIGHNCQLGRRVIIAAQTGLSGGVRLGDDVVVGGQVGFVEQVTVAPGTQVGAGSGVMREVPGGVWLGSPARPIATTKRIWAALKYLPAMFRRS